MSTVILFRYCICDLFSILCNMLFVVNVANKANGTLNYLKVATLGNFGDYSYTEWFHIENDHKSITYNL